MLTSMFLSMWISNTASTAMMVPIANAIIRELYKVNVFYSSLRVVIFLYFFFKEKVQQKKETTSLPASKSTQSLGSISSISIETISASSESSNAISALESQPRCVVDSFLEISFLTFLRAVKSTLRRARCESAFYSPWPTRQTSEAPPP